MSALIFDVGLGLFVILGLWIFAALIFFISLRIKKNVGALAFFGALIITVILVSVPRSDERDTLFDKKSYDHLVFWRLTLVIVLALSALISTYGYVKFVFLEAAKPQRIKDWVY